MDKLRVLVDELEKAQDKCRIAEILKQIGERLINEYEINIGNYVIEPLLVEAYYNSGTFADDSVHASKESNANTYKLARQRQKGHYGELYVHYGTKDGIDIVLSEGDYYLSFLIKNALVHTIDSPQFARQCKISEMLCGNCDGRMSCEKGMNCKYYGEIVLKPVHPKNNEVVFVKRKGIKNSYANCPLSVLPINKIRDYKFTAGESSTDIIKRYVEQQTLTRDYDEEKLKKLAKGLVAWDTFNKRN